MKKKIILFALSLIMIIGFTACTKEAPAKETNGDTQTEAKIAVTHELGEIDISTNPKKVVVFDYAILDNLNTLDIEIVGLPKQSLPEYLEDYNDEKYVDLGGLKEPDFEAVNKLQPDIILIGGRQAELYDEFAKIAPTVYLTVDNTDYLGSFSENAKTLGKIFEKEAEVEEKLATINASIGEVHEKVTKNNINALILMTNEGNINAYGQGSRFGVIHDEFGFVPVDENIEVSKHGQSVSFEYIVEKNPEYIFVISRDAAIAEGGTDSVLDNRLVATTDAYKNEKIINLNSEVWYLVSGGLEGTNMMIEEIIEAVK